MNEAVSEKSGRSLYANKRSLIVVAVAFCFILSILYSLEVLSLEQVFIMSILPFLPFLFLARQEALLLALVATYFGVTYFSSSLVIEGLIRSLFLLFIGLVLLLKLGTKRVITRITTPLDKIIFLWLVIVLISFLNGFYFKHNNPRYLLGDLYKFVEIFLVFWLTTLIAKNDREIRFLIWGFLFVALTFGVVDSAIFFKRWYLEGNVLLARARAAAQFSSIFALTLTVALILHARRIMVRAFLIFLSLGFLVSFLLCFLRTGYVAIPPTLAFVLLLYLGKNKKFSLRGLMKFTAVVMCLLVAVLLLNLGLTAINPDLDIIKGTVVRFHSLIDPFSEDPISISVRLLEIKSIISQVLVRYPLLGKGLGGEYYTATNVPEGIEWGMKHYVHNNYFEFLIRTGILGLAIFLVVAFKYFRDAVKIYLRSENSFHQGLVLGCLGIFVSSCIMALSASILYSPFLFITMALVYSVASIEEKNVTRPENPG